MSTQRKPMNHNHLDLFNEAVLAITSSLDLRVAMRNAFAFLSRHFPIDAISLHQFSRQLRGIMLVFLVDRSGFKFIERFVPVSDAQWDFFAEHENSRVIYNIPNWQEHVIASFFGSRLTPWVPGIPRSYMVGMMPSGDDIIGHLLFIGDGRACFTKEHECLMRLLSAPFGLAMMNMLQFKEVLEFQASLKKKNLTLEQEVDRLRGYDIIGAQCGLKDVVSAVYQLADRETPVLILGETGTGKELIADAIQRVSKRRDAPFIKVNCGAIPDTLIDSELFGYEKGAFTGAYATRAGLFEHASRGTLFLDEVGELPAQAQVRLLRVLQNGIIERVGSANPIPVDVRIIAATNKNLEDMMQKNQFREDLYYRLHVFPIHVPPLRKRRDDIPLLLSHFAQKIAERMDIRPPEIAPESLERLRQYSWPGNVRELQNLVERSLVLSPKGPLDLTKVLPKDPDWYMDLIPPENALGMIIDKRVHAILQEYGIAGASSQKVPHEEHTPSVRPSILSLGAANKAHITAALRSCGGKVYGPGGAAEMLGVNHNTLRKRMKKLGISAKNL